MKIYGFLQVRNEVSSGHLARFLDLNSELFDSLFAIDDASDDGTPEALRSSGAVLVENSDSNFKSESKNKSLLLDEVAKVAVDGDAILWLDADEVLYCTRSELEDLINKAFSQGYDSISMNHLNLWRSNHHYRVDDQYFGLKPVRIWRFSKNLRFPTGRGLHKQTHPAGLKSTFHSNDFPVVHFGFASLELILNKYATYDLLWQSGYLLDRLVNEDGLTLAKLSDYRGALGGRFIAPQAYDSPEPISPYLWKQLASQARNASRRSQKPQITVICLIFKSLSWLEFSYAEALRLQREFKRGEVDILFVANDATPDVLKFLQENRIPHIQASGKSNKDEWYINSVYRAYNEGVRASRTPWVYLINSDMAFAPGALDNVFSERSQKSLLTTRLVERGALPTGKHGIEKDFGKSPKAFRRKDFLSFAHSISLEETQPGGLFMPVLLHRESFLQQGAFPEGNIRRNSLDSYLKGKNFSYATYGEDCIPGDAAFFAKLEKAGFIHLTSFRSIAYHFQEGELRGKADDVVASGFAVMNDLTDGIHGEEVLWTRLKRVFALSSNGRGVIETGMPEGKLGHFFNPVRLWIRGVLASRSTQYRLIFSNATFQIPHRFAKSNVVLVQDRVKTFWLKVLQRISIFLADRVVSNDLEFISRYRRKNPIWLEISRVTYPLSASLESNGARSQDSSSLTAIFIGAFNQTKGFELLSSLVLANSDINWILVSKSRGDSAGPLAGLPNVRILYALSQNELSHLIRESDFLVGTSPWETQHLASLEALEYGVPVFITPTGFLGYKNRGLHPYGMVADSAEFLTRFEEFKSLFRAGAFRNTSPVSIGGGESDLYDSLEELLQETFIQGARKSKIAVFTGRLVSFGLNLSRLVARRYLIPVAIRFKKKIVSLGR